ncbi:alpha/beta-hydrolase, partial [Melanomma pulvis-pyrius CBS 109.77]
LFYTVQGSPESPPILLIHGWTTDSHDWNWQIPVLAETHYVIAMDLRGHGRSDAPTDIPYTPQEFAKDAAALLRHLKFEKDVIVMGHSMGGVITSTLTVQEPDLVKAFIVIDPPYWAPGPMADYIMTTANAAPDIHAWLGEFGKVHMVPTIPAWMKTWYGRRAEGTPSHVILDCLAALYNEGGLGREDVHLAFIEGKRKCPRLAVYAKAEDTEKERALGVGPSDEVTSIEGFGHWIMQSKSEEFNQILGKWLQNLE